MNARTKTGALINALRALFPASDMSIIHERPWYSLTFCGTQICLSVDVAEAKIGDDIADLSHKLSEHEFVLPGQIVADIAITRAFIAEAGHCLIIDALLLDA